MAVLITRFCRDSSGATAIEYALIAGFVSIVILTAALTIGTTLNGTFTTVAGAIK